jgi:hypothetical protein
MRTSVRSNRDLGPLVGSVGTGSPKVLGPEAKQELAGAGVYDPLAADPVPKLSRVGVHDPAAVRHTI